jgi:hypothetical protein
MHGDSTRETGVVACATFCARQADHIVLALRGVIMEEK